MATSSTRSAVVFDLDGTLVEVGARDYAVYRDLLGEDGLAVLPFAEYWPMRRNRIDLARLLGRSVDDPSAYLPGFVERRTARYEEPRYLALDKVLPDVCETLDQLGARHDCIVITSRKDAEATEQQLVALDLRRRVGTVHCCDGDKSAAFRRVADVVMVVGDTEHDIRLAQAHACRSFAVTTGIRSRDFLATQSPTYLADSLTDLLSVL